jgi:hypothetical protein
MTIWVQAGSFVLQCLKTCSCTIQHHRILQNHMSLQICNASSLYVHGIVLPACQQSLFYSHLFSHGKMEVNVDKSQSIILLIEL